MGSWSDWFAERRERRIAQEKAPRPLFMGELIEGENRERYRAWLSSAIWVFR